MTKIKIPFYLKLSLIISFLIVIIAAGISSTLLNETKSAYKNQVRSSSKLLANIIVQYSSEAVVMENYSSLTNIINNLKDDPDSNISRVSVTNPAGEIMVSTEKAVVGEKIILNDKQNSSFDFHNDFLDVKAPIIAYDNLWGILEFRYSLSSFNQMLLNTKKQIYLLSLLFIIFGLLIAFIISKNIVKPINQLVLSAKEIAAGNFNKPVTVKSRDEFSFLAATLEEMRIDLKYFVSKVAKKAVSYEGNLNFFNLSSLLRLLNNSKNSGGLVLKQKHKFGIIYFENGEIVNAVVEKETAENALFDFLHWTKGEFKFSPKLKNEKNLINKDFNKLLLNLGRQIQDQKVFKQLIPASDLIIYPAVSKINKSFEKFTLNKDEKLILKLINGQRSLKDLTQKSGWKLKKTREILYRLILIGLITVNTDEIEAEKNNSMKNIIPFPAKQNSN